MDYLKKKLLSRLENSSPEVQKMREDPQINKWDFLKEEWPQNLRAWFDKVERGWGYFRAFFLRFRSSKENSSLLPVALFFFLIVDLVFNFSVFFIIFWCFRWFCWLLLWLPLGIASQIRRDWSMFILLAWWSQLGFLSFGWDNNFIKFLLIFILKFLLNFIKFY